MKNKKMKKIIVGITLYASIFMIGAQNFTFAKNVLNESQINENNTINEDGNVCKEVIHKLYLKGYPDESIRPNGDITRDEVAAILNRVYKLDMKSINIQFKDLFESDWSYEDVIANIKAGVLKGYPDGTIRRGAPITRAETAAMLVRLEGDALNKSKPNTDYTNHWASKEIETAIKKGYLIGYEDGSIRPDTNITRAEFATTINRLIGRNYDIKDLEKINIFTDLNFTTKGQWFYEDMVRASNDYIQKICTDIKLKPEKSIVPPTNKIPYYPETPEVVEKKDYTVNYWIRTNDKLVLLDTVKGKANIDSIINNKLVGKEEIYTAPTSEDGSELVYQLEDKDFILSHDNDVLDLVYEPLMVKIRATFTDIETLEEVVIEEFDETMGDTNVFFEAQVGKFMDDKFGKECIRFIENYKYKKIEIPSGHDGKVPNITQGENPSDKDKHVLTILLKYKEVHGIDQRPKDPETGLPIDPKSGKPESSIDVSKYIDEEINL